MFYYPINEHVMQAITNVYNDKKPVDIVTVTTEMRKMGEASNIGVYLADLSSTVISDINVATYGQEIMEKYACRSAIERSMEIQQAAYDSNLDDVLIKAAEMEDILLNNLSAVNAVDINAIFAENTHTIEERSKGENRNFIDCGIRAIDRVLGGFEPGNLIVIAGRPSMGKTAFALQLAYNISDFHPVLYFTLEMTREEIGNRYLVMLTDIDGNRLKRGEGITGAEWKLIDEAGKKLKDHKLIIDDTSHLSIYNLRSKIFRLVRSSGVKLVVIDYLQLMEGQKGKDGAEYYGTISRTCKQVAKELKITIILLSQLNRDVEKRGEKIPRLYDLRACLSTETSLIYTERNVQSNVASQINLLSLQGNKLCNMKSTNIPKLNNDVYRVRTSSGRFVDATINHRVLTTEGYREIRNLTTDDVLIVAKNFETKGTYYKESHLIGLMLGNGSMAGKGVPALIVNDKDVSDYFINYIYDNFGFYPKRHKHRSVGVFQWDITKDSVRTKEGNPFKKWLIEKQLWGNYSYTKTIPDWFMEKADSQSIYELMAGLIETDGSVYRVKSSALNISYSTVSLKLAQQILYLLAKIGIIARVDDGYKSKKATCKSYKITINDCYYIKLFREKIPLIGYKAIKLNQFNLNRRVSYLSNKISHETSVNISELIKKGRLQIHGYRCATKATLLKLSLNNDLGKYKWLLSDNIHFDRIRSIAHIGVVDIFDRHVPSTNNFVVNGIVVHNSGEIEQDADVVMFPVRCGFAGINDPEKGLDASKAIIAIGKNRHGRIADDNGNNIRINVSPNAALWWDENDIFLGPKTPVAQSWLKDD